MDVQQLKSFHDNDLLIELNRFERELQGFVKDWSGRLAQCDTDGLLQSFDAYNHLLAGYVQLNQCFTILTNSRFQRAGHMQDYQRRLKVYGAALSFYNDELVQIAPAAITSPVVQRYVHYLQARPDAGVSAADYQAIREDLQSLPLGTEQERTRYALAWHWQLAGRVGQPALPWVRGLNQVAEPIAQAAKAIVEQAAAEISVWKDAAGALCAYENRQHRRSYTPLMPLEEARAMILAATRDVLPDLSGAVEQALGEGTLRQEEGTAGRLVQGSGPGRHIVSIGYSGSYWTALNLCHEVGHLTHFEAMSRHQDPAFIYDSFDHMHMYLRTEMVALFSEWLIADHWMESAPPEQAILMRAAILNKCETFTHSVRLKDDAQHADCTAYQETGKIPETLQAPFFPLPGYPSFYLIGQLLANLLYQSYQDHKAQGTAADFLRLYQTGLLEQGYDTSLAECLRPLGVDLNDPDLWNTALQPFRAVYESVQPQLQEWQKIKQAEAERASIFQMQDMEEATPFQRWATRCRLAKGLPQR